MTTIKKYWKLLVLILLIIIISFFFNEINYLFNNTENILKKAGMFSIFLYIFLMIIAILIAPIPASPLVIVAASFFGPFYGLIYTLISATIGAVLAFIISRFFLYNYVSQKIENNEFYKKIKGQDNKNVVFLIFISRLIPYISFDIVSYAAGLTNIRIITFASVTFLGMIPMVFILSFFGALIKSHLPIFFLILIIIFISQIIYSFLKNNTNKRV